MKTSRLWLGLLATGCVGILAGCPTRENADASGLTCDPATHICVGTLAITSPSQTAYTNGMITIQVAATPGNNPPAEVEIRVDGTMLTTVQQPFSYAWDTKNASEGSHQVDATATIGGTTITSKPVTIWVDRTPPFIAMRTPAQNATNVALSDPIQIVVFRGARSVERLQRFDIALVWGNNPQHDRQSRFGRTHRRHHLGCPFHADLPGDCHRVRERGHQGFGRERRRFASKLVLDGPFVGEDAEPGRDPCLRGARSHRTRERRILVGFHQRRGSDACGRSICGGGGLGHDRRLPHSYGHGRRLRRGRRRGARGCLVG